MKKYSIKILLEKIYLLINKDNFKTYIYISSMTKSLENSILES